MNRFAKALYNYLYPPRQTNVPYRVSFNQKSLRPRRRRPRRRRPRIVRYIQ